MSACDPDNPDTCEDPEELKQFEQTQVSEGLQFMLDLTFADPNQKIEVASYLVQNENNEIILIVFDTEGNTENSSRNPKVGITETGKVLYDGNEVLAQVHTHPGGNATPSPADEKVSEVLRAPVFALTKDNIGIAIGSAFRSRILGEDFKSSVVNNGRSDRLIDYTKTLKQIIQKSRN